MENKIDYKIIGKRDDKYYTLNAVSVESDESYGSLSFSLEYKERRAWLYDINVEEQYQGNGIGQALLTNFERECVNKRLFYVEGKYYPSNSGARMFYVKNNYEIFVDGYEKFISKSLDPDLVEEQFNACSHKVVFEPQKEN